MSKTTRTLALLAAALTVTVAPATEPPDSALNPQNGVIATVDAVVVEGDANVRITFDPGQGQGTSSVFLTSASGDDVDPRVEITASGDVWVVYEHAGSIGEVRVIKQTYSNQEWGTDRLASDPEEDSGHPDLAISDTTPWVAFEIADTSTTSLAVVAVADEPTPFGARTILATTSYSGEVDVKVVAASGFLWTTWVDSETEVGWSAYDPVEEAWSSPELESYDGDTVEAARDRIKGIVTGN